MCGMKSSIYFRIISFQRVKRAVQILRKEGWAGIKYHFHLVRDKERGKEENCRKEYDIYHIREEDYDRFRKADHPEPIEFKESREPLVSIIIPVYNQAVYTYYCLKSISKHTECIDYEIIVGDDCSADITLEMEKWARGIGIIHHKENCQFVKNCNRVSKKARGKYIVFLNNDTQVQQGWLKALVDVMEKDPNVGLTGAKLIYPDGLVQEAGGIVWQDAHVLQYGNGRQAGEKELNELREADYISGAAIMLRRKLWEEIGGFDERFVPAYYEDVDLAFQVRERGYKVVYQPRAEVVHVEGITEMLDERRKMEIEKNREMFLEKWKRTLAKEHFMAKDYPEAVRNMRKYY